jgi:hypothetical protein
MATKEFLEQFPSPLLAVMCGDVAREPAMGEATIQRAIELKREWVLLQQPPASNYKEEEQRQKKRADLKSRMAHFLASI